MAVPVRDLYRMTLPVPSRETDVRAKALQQALLAVLVRVSGGEAVTTQPTVTAQLKSAESLIDEYKYDQKQINGEQQLQLQASFDPAGVNHLLQGAGIPVWGADRPLILVFMVSDGDGGQHLLTEDADRGPVDALTHAGGTYGLPVIFPLMDLKDIGQKITPAAVLSGNLPLLTAAATRYESDGVLLGEIHSVPSGGVQLSATLALEDEHWQWQLSESDADAAFSALAGRMAGILSARQAVLASSGTVTDLHLQVRGIRGGEDIAAVSDWLKQEPQVRGVEVLQILGDHVILVLHFRGTPDDFQLRLAGNTHLVQVGPGEYEWRG